MATLSAKFGRVLREARCAQGLSQEKLAELSDLDRTFISMIERGKRKPTLDTAHRLANALGTKLSTLITLAERRRS